MKSAADYLMLGRPGLAGGIDVDGSRAAELLALGFGSVEFGTVSPYAGAGQYAHADLLAQRLAALTDPTPNHPHRSLVGIGLGLPPGAAPGEVAGHWLAGMQSVWAVADYLSFNLSAAAHRPLMAVRHAVRLNHALHRVAIEGERLRVATGRHVMLGLKLPITEHDPAPAAACLALNLGFQIITAVLPDSPVRWNCLQTMSGHIKPGGHLLAVGGIRGSDDVRLALQAGATGIQVHRLFVEQGAACLSELRRGLTPSPATQG